MAKIGQSRPKLYMISATYGSEAPVHLLYHLLHIHEESKPSETSGNKCSRQIDENLSLLHIDVDRIKPPTFVAKTRNYDIFVAKIYDYALIDSF